jgi:hypothetical protein
MQKLLGNWQVASVILEGSFWESGRPGFFAWGSDANRFLLNGEQIAPDAYRRIVSGAAGDGAVLSNYAELDSLRNWSIIDIIAQRKV